MTPLRQRMLEDMQMRNLSRGTQMVYVRAVMQLARHYRKSPDQLQREDIRGYLVYLAQQRRVAPSTYNQTRCALKFFYQVTLGQEWVFDRIVCQKSEKHLPVVLSQSEVVRFFGAIRKMKLKFRALFMTIYGTGLRGSEAAALKVSDIDKSAHGHPCASGQRKEGSLCDALAQAVGGSAGVLEGLPTTNLALLFGS